MQNNFITTFGEIKARFLAAYETMEKMQSLEPGTSMAGILEIVSQVTPPLPASLIEPRKRKSERARERERCVCMRENEGKHRGARNRE